MTVQPGRRSARARGYDSRWDKARRTFLGRHPLCCMCERAGIVNRATVVDHVVPHRGDQRLFWDVGNWQPLCSSHHSRDKQTIERGGKPKPTIGPDGWPIGPKT